jgi:hypothetical protein
MLLDHLFDLFLGQTSEGEHTNLLGDVGPVSLNSTLLKGSSKSITHVVHSLGHVYELFEPLGTQLFVV